MKTTQMACSLRCMSFSAAARSDRPTEYNQKKKNRHAPRKRASAMAAVKNKLSRSGWVLKTVSVIRLFSEAVYMRRSIATRTCTRVPQPRLRLARAYSATPESHKGPAQVTIDTDKTWQKLVVDGSQQKPVLVDFHAVWCGAYTSDYAWTVRSPLRSMQDPHSSSRERDWKGASLLISLR